MKLDLKIEDYKSIEEVVKKIASENEIKNVSGVNIKLSKEKGLIKFAIDKNKTRFPIYNKFGRSRSLDEYIEIFDVNFDKNWEQEVEEYFDYYSSEGTMNPDPYEIGKISISIDVSPIPYEEREEFFNEDREPIVNEGKIIEFAKEDMYNYLINNISMDEQGFNEAVKEIIKMKLPEFVKGFQAMYSGNKHPFEEIDSSFIDLEFENPTNEGERYIKYGEFSMIFDVNIFISRIF